MFCTISVMTKCVHKIINIVILAVGDPASPADETILLLPIKAELNRCRSPGGFWMLSCEVCKGPGPTMIDARTRLRYHAGILSCNNGATSYSSIVPS